MNRRWGHVEELLATLVELAHAQYRVQLQSPWFKRQNRPLQPLRWPRPGQPTPEKPKLRPRDFVRVLAGSE